MLRFCFSERQPGNFISRIRTENINDLPAKTFFQQQKYT